MSKVIDPLIGARHANELWLRGWGCEVQEWAFCRAVRHPDIAEYNAIYDLRSPKDVGAAIDLARDIAYAPGRPVTIFVPDSPDFQQAALELKREGYIATHQSQSVVVDCTSFGKRKLRQGVLLSRVTPLTIGAWIDTYERNYGSQMVPSEAGRSRWMRLFGSEPRVLFLLLESRGYPYGTAQLADPGNGCCGVYSLSVVSECRGTSNLRHVAWQLIQLVLQRGSRWLSFDRVRPVSRMKVVRGTLAPEPSRLWQTVSSEIGYRPSAP